MNKILSVILIIATPVFAQDAGSDAPRNQFIEGGVGVLDDGKTVDLEKGVCLNEKARLMTLDVLRGNKELIIKTTNDYNEVVDTANRRLEPLTVVLIAAGVLAVGLSAGAGIAVAAQKK